MPIDIVQKLIVEVDSTKLLEQYLQLAITTALNSYEELAVKFVNPTEKNLNIYMPSVFTDPNKHFPVIFISGWYSLEGCGKNSYFNGWRPWTTFRSHGAVSAVDGAIRYIKLLLEEHGKTWGAQFKDKFGDGYNEWFNRNDGSVELGYELRACGCFPEWLAISIVHIYYGK